MPTWTLKQRIHFIERTEGVRGRWNEAVRKAPAGAKGYRVGIKHARSQIMLWFPAVKHCPLGMFLLEPFQWPEVAVAGTYAVVYMDRRFRPIGGPRFTIAITHTDKRLHYSDGDRTFKSRPRG
jgi:hypothetical protein